MIPKRIEASVRVARRSRSAGLSIAQLHGEHLPRHLDPFLAFDHFQMAQPFFPPHPHAGFSAVTYMFPQSPGGFVNRDSRGETIEIHPGDLHWTAAGSGLMHEEVPIARGTVCHGLQLFVNLHSSRKWSPPEVLHLEAARIPKAAAGKSEIRVVFGRHGGLASPLMVPTAATLLDVVLEPGGQLVHPVPDGESRFLYVIDGDVQVGPVDAPVRLQAGDAVGFSSDGDTLALACAADHPAHLVVGGGVPLREPEVFYGPFCMNTQEEIARAIAAFQAGRMGHLEPSF